MRVVLSIDQDRTVCETIRHISEKFGKDCELAFANGGDQSNESSPEAPICNELGINLIDGLEKRSNLAVGFLKKRANGKINLKKLIHNHLL